MTKYQGLMNDKVNLIQIDGCIVRLKCSKDNNTWILIIYKFF